MGTATQGHTAAADHLLQRVRSEFLEMPGLRFDARSGDSIFVSGSQDVL